MMKNKWKKAVAEVVESFEACRKYNAERFKGEKTFEKCECECHYEDE